MENLEDISLWKQSFGLLPIHLKVDPLTVEPSFIMLNGGYGDFCLQLKDTDKNQEYYNSNSWSCNTKNFVLVNDNSVEIFNWLKDKPEKISAETVKLHFSKFYKYLLSNSYKSEKDIVPFVINIFRQLRNITKEKSDPVNALNLLFILLASLEDNPHQLDFKKWQIPETILPPNFDYYLELIKTGISKTKPNLNLILRHASGMLFQEAQKEVLFFNSQIELFGGVSNKLETQKKLYSSIHYTPSYLARTIVENALKEVDLTSAHLKVLDPACGSGEFLIEVLKQLNEADFKGTINVFGWDTSPTAINTTKFLLAFEKRKIWKEVLNFNIELVNDSLSQEWGIDYDLILMNPPFVSWEQMSKESRDNVRQVLLSNIIGRPNQASAFFFKAIQSLSPKGIIGCVVPSSLLTLDAYKKLRDDTSELLSINLIGKLGTFVFEDALTDVSILIGQKKSSETVPTVLWVKNEKGLPQEALRDLRKMQYKNEYSIDEKDYSVFQPISFPIVKESWKPISLKENELFKKIERFVFERKLVRIEDIFNVQQGIRTGDNLVFKLSLDEYMQLPIDEQKYFRKCIDNDSIKNGLFIESGYIWYPYDNKGIVIKTEEDLQKVAPFFYNNRLKNAKQKLENRASVQDENWWHLSRHRVWLQKKESRLISTEFGKSDSFAFDVQGNYVIERGNAWLPIKKFDSIDYYYFYLAIFSSSFFDKLLSIYSKELLSGYDLGKKYTKQIPIPNVYSPEVTNSYGYINLVNIGKEMSKDIEYFKNVSNEYIIKFFYPEV